MHTSEARFDQALRRRIYEYFAEAGRAPDVDELAGLTDATDEHVRASLERLAAARTVVLRPTNGQILTAPPFSAAPTLFWVSSHRGGWWGACAWCALGIPAMLGDDATITSRLGGEQEPIELSVRDGAPTRSDLLVHFAVPAARWAEDMGYACSTILLFRAETAIDEWCARHRIPRGASLSLEQTWALARGWFGDGLDPHAARRSRADAQAILEKAGLTDAFWRLR